jgi:Na+-driven multidrug efflux pump
LVFTFLYNQGNKAMQSNFKKKFIGDKEFYKMVLAVAVPIMIQNGITNFVSLLDNIMVGQIGTEQMSGVAAVMIMVAPLFPQIYNTSNEAKAIAVQFIVAQAIFMPQNAFIHAAYFTLRSGGKTIVTFLFDSAFVWCASVPVAYCLSRFTAVPVIVIFVMVNIADWIKCIIGFVLVKKGVWLQNIVTE